MDGNGTFRKTLMGVPRQKSLGPFVGVRRNEQKGNSNGHCCDTLVRMTETGKNKCASRCIEICAT